MKKAKMMIAGLAAALTLTFASGHAMAADISTSTPLMLRVSQWAAQECCGKKFRKLSIGMRRHRQPGLPGFMRRHR